MSFDPEEDFERTPELDDSPTWWAFVLLPPIVAVMAMGYAVLAIFDRVRRVLG